MLNSSRATLNLEAVEREAAPRSRVSSANKAWLMFLTPLAIRSPIKSWSCIFFPRRKLRVDAWMTNSRGERGHPCLRPLEALKKSVALPFTRGAIHGSETQARIQLMKFDPNPNLFITFNKKLWFTRSNTFARSSLIIIPCSAMETWVDCLLNKGEVVHYLPPLDETALILRDYFREYMLQTICYDFCD